MNVTVSVTLKNQRLFEKNINTTYFIYSVRAIPVNIIWEGETELVFSVS